MNRNLSGLYTFDNDTHKYIPIAQAKDILDLKDYEEPKDFWFIDNECGVIYDATDESLWDKQYDIKFMKAIGNYFNTLDEAEQAVEKLKAVKRLKDKGFKFIGVRPLGKVIDFDMPEPYHRIAFGENIDNEDKAEFYKDLMMLFGGKE